MLRLTFVFCIWLASTAQALDEQTETAARLTDTNVRAIFAADERADDERRAHARSDPR